MGMSKKTQFCFFLSLCVHFGLFLAWYQANMAVVFLYNGFLSMVLAFLAVGGSTQKF